MTFIRRSVFPYQRFLYKVIFAILAMYGFIEVVTSVKKIKYHEKNVTEKRIARSLSDAKLEADQKVVRFIDNDHNVDHCVFYNFYKRSVISNGVDEPISLVLHSTIQYSHHIVKQAKTWDGPISYAIFFYPGDSQALIPLGRLHKCHDSVRQKVSIHLVWHRGFLQTDCAADDTMKSVFAIANEGVSCEDFNLESVMAELQNIKIQIGTYPINIMRNEARRGASSKLHLVGDIETQWSYNFTNNVKTVAQNLLNGEYGKVVLIYRRFEQEFDSEFPADFKTFVELLEQKKIVEFHNNTFSDGHVIDGLDTWINVSLNSNQVTLTNVSYRSYFFEPQFIMRFDAPYHFEHVPIRYLDHQFLCYELCRAGYSFMLMTHVYNIHPGIKSNHTKFEEVLNEYGNAQAKSVLKKYTKYLKSHYAFTEEIRSRCPKWGKRHLI